MRVSRWGCVEGLVMLSEAQRSRSISQVVLFPLLRERALWGRGVGCALVSRRVLTRGEGQGEGEPVGVWGTLSC